MHKVTDPFDRFQEFLKLSIRKENCLVLARLSPRSKRKTITEEEVSELFDKVSKMKFPPRVDPPVFEFSEEEIQNLKGKGKIQSITENSAVGVTKVEFTNGVKVLLKHDPNLFWDGNEFDLRCLVSQSTFFDGFSTDCKNFL